MEKIKSKLWGIYSSNLTCFQLTRREFVFFTRGGSRLLTPSHLFNCALNMAWYFIKIDLVQFCNKYMVGPSQKTHLGHSKNGKWFFSSKENVNSLRQHCLEFQDAPLCTIWNHLNKLCHECGHKIIIWLESHESSRMIAHFGEHFLKIIVVLQVYYFSWHLGHI